MSETDIIANMVHGWGTKPDTTLIGIKENSTSAALWCAAQDHRVEVGAAPDHSKHIIAFQLNKFAADSWSDDRMYYSGRHYPGTCNVIRAGEHPRSIITGAFKILHIYLPTTIVATAAERLTSGPVEIVDPRCRPSPTLLCFAREILAEMRIGSELSRLRIDILGQEFALALLRHHSSLSGTPTVRNDPVLGGLAPWQLKRACEAMEASLGVDIGLDDLAKVAGCSPTHFSRAFKQSTGMPPFQWLNQRRIARAKELLAGGRMPLAEVALAVGFSAQPQFTTAFGRATGTTPGRWRRERLS